MARNGILTALQAALLGISGGAQGLVQAREREQRTMQEQKDREQRELMNLVTFGREAITPGPLATRAPAGAATPAAPKGPPPPMPTSAIPLPSSPVDMTGAMRQLETEEATPSGTIPMTFAGQTIYVPIGQRYRDEKEAERLRAQAADIESALAKEQALQPLRMALATAPTIAAGRVAAGRETAEAGRAAKTAEQKRQEAFEGLKSVAYPGITEIYNKNIPYEDMWASYTKMSPTDRLTLQSVAGTSPVSMQYRPGYQGGATPAGGQRKPFVERLTEVKAQPGMTPEKAMAQMASEGYDVINMR